MCVCVKCVSVCVCVCVYVGLYIPAIVDRYQDFLRANVDLCEPWTSSFFRGGPLDC